jgi:hypothetical protein
VGGLDDGWVCQLCQGDFVMEGGWVFIYSGVVGPLAGVGCLMFSSSFLPHKKIKLVASFSHKFLRSNQQMINFNGR